MAAPPGGLAGAALAKLQAYKLARAGLQATHREYSLHTPRRGHDDIKVDLEFWGAADLIAEGDYVVGRWEGGGTHTGPALRDFLIGSLPAAIGRKMEARASRRSVSMTASRR